MIIINVTKISIPELNIITFDDLKVGDTFLFLNKTTDPVSPRLTMNGMAIKTRSNDYIPMVKKAYVTKNEYTYEEYRSFRVCRILVEGINASWELK